MTVKYTKEEISARIGELTDPSRNGRSLAELGAIKHIGFDEDKQGVVLLIEVGKKDNETTAPITRQIAKIIKIDMGYPSLVLEFEQARPKALTKTVKIIGIASGKGGVGKSTVTANLAYALTSLGKKVGIIDADIYGANMPKIMECVDENLMPAPNEKLYPLEIDKIEMVSTEYFVEKDHALMWRGPFLSKVLKLFFEDTLWNPELDYLLIDLPPGTGDVMMDIKNFVPDCKMVLVTTPHPDASHVAIKAGFAAISLKEDLLGVLENMSYFETEGKQYNIFGEGGGKLVAEKLGVPLIGRIPIGQPAGKKHSVFGETEPIGLIYLGIAKKIMDLYEDN
ncbi:MAG TPA: P-loop NTPase [Candidatus Izemoplasmatales bacterium]|nr:P-loop NTPase [Candidatus Izemoplasmatales bacterium]